MICAAGLFGQAANTFTGIQKKKELAMTGKATCLDLLRGFIERSDRGELAEAQAAIIQFALAAPDMESRSQAMSALQTELAADIQSKALDPMQSAYYSVIDAMIDRTRDAVLRGRAAKVDG